MSKKRKKKASNIPAKKKDVPATTTPSGKLPSPVPAKPEVKTIEKAVKELSPHIKALAVLGRAAGLYLPVVEVLFPAFLKILGRIDDSPQSREMMGHDREIENKREAARNEQILAKARIDDALAKRIETAESVLVEEYYDVSGKGHAGLSVDETSAKFGVGGEGQRIVSRRITLKGSTTGKRTEEVVHIDEELPVEGTGRDNPEVVNPPMT